MEIGWLVVGTRFTTLCFYFMKCLGMSPRNDDVLAGNDRGRQDYSAFEPIDHW